MSAGSHQTKTWKSWGRLSTCKVSSHMPLETYRCVTMLNAIAAEAARDLQFIRSLDFLTPGEKKSFSSGQFNTSQIRQRVSYPRLNHSKPKITAASTPLTRRWYTMACDSSCVSTYPAGYPSRKTKRSRAKLTTKMGATHQENCQMRQTVSQGS